MRNVIEILANLSTSSEISDENLETRDSGETSEKLKSSGKSLSLLCI